MRFDWDRYGILAGVTAGPVLFWTLANGTIWYWELWASVALFLAAIGLLMFAETNKVHLSTNAHRACNWGAGLLLVAFLLMADRVPPL
ncbi:hypothetical protein [Mameliella alba]|nr:hypothetical protein [Mameliella alba]